MFYGSHSINMDAKGRVAIPTRVRELLHGCCDGKIVLTAHTENRCIHIFTEPQWQDILPKVESWSSFNATTRRARLLLLGHATPFQLDDGGRILLPQTLRDYAGLEKKTILVGQGKGLELWDEAEFSRYIDTPLQGGDMPEEMQNLSL